MEKCSICAYYFHKWQETNKILHRPRNKGPTVSKWTLMQSHNEFQEFRNHVLGCKVSNPSSNPASTSK